VKLCSNDASGRYVRFSREFASDAARAARACRTFGCSAVDAALGLAGNRQPHDGRARGECAFAGTTLAIG